MSCKLIKLSETSTAIICGIKDDCEHDDLGDFLLFDDENNYYKQKETPNPNDYHKYRNFMIKKNIVGGCVSCSKCGKPFSPPMF